MKTLTSLVGIVARDESTYIEECILHNLLVGFDKVVVGLHKCVDDTQEKIECLQQRFPDKIEYFEVQRTKQKHSLGWLWYQEECYLEIYKRYKGKAEWMACFDVDECYWDRNRRPVNELLGGLPEKVGQVQIPWLVFGASNRVFSVPKEESRYRWFGHRSMLEHSIHTKPIVRLDALNTELRSWWWCHFCDLCKSYQTIDVYENRIVEGGMVKCFNPPITERNVLLAHYRTGSMEDYVAREKRCSERRTTRDIHDFFCQNAPYVDDRMMIYHEEMMRLKNDSN